MKALHVSMVSVTENSENEQRKRKMKWRGRRDVPAAKKKRVTETNMDLIFFRQQWL